MKKLLTLILTLVILSPLFVSAQLRVITVPQGGTGASTLTGCLTGNGTGAITGNGSACAGSSFTWPFTKQADGSQATSTLLSLLGGIFTNASSTLASTTISNLLVLGSATSTNFFTNTLLAFGSTTLQKFTATNSTTTNATTTSIAFTTATGTTVYASNFVDTSFSGNNCVGESSGLLGQATNCVSSIASAGSSLTVSSPTGNVDLSLNLGHTNNWTILQTFTNASSTLFSTTYASTSQLCLSGDCKTAWPTSSMTFAWPFTKQADGSQGTTTVMSFLGGFYSSASSTFTDLLGLRSTTTSATSTNLYSSATLTGGTELRVKHEAGNIDIGTITDGSSGASYQGIFSLYCSGGNCTTSGQKIKLDSGDSNSWINTGGNVGIGISAPTTKLHVSGGFLATASSTIGANTNTTGLTISGGATTTGTSLHLASTTLQNFTATNATTSQATTTAFSVSNNFITLGSSPAYVGTSTARMMPFASTSPLDASGFSISIGTTTYQIGSFPTSVKLVSIVGQASTTGSASGGFLCKIGTLPSTFSETVLFNQNYAEYSVATNPNIPAHTPIVVMVSKASSTPQTGWCQGNFIKTSSGTN
jgi:hypothetical protein